MLFVIFFILGMVSGVLLNNFIRTNGILHIDTTDPEGQYLFLQLSNDITHLKKVTFKVNKKIEVSQK